MTAGITRRDAAKAIVAAALVTTAGVAVEAADDPIFALIDRGRALWNEYEAAKAAGKEWGRDSNGDEWLHDFDAMWDADYAIIEAVPTTVAGLFAKVEYLAKYECDNIPDDGKVETAAAHHGSLADETMMTAIIRDVKALKGGVS